MCERVAERKGKPGCTDDASKCGILKILVEVYNATGMREEAVSAAVRVLAVGQVIYRRHDKLTLSRLESNLGELFCGMGQWAKAKSVLEETPRGIENMIKIEGNAKVDRREDEPRADKEEESYTARAPRDILDRLDLKVLTLQHVQAAHKGLDKDLKHRIWEYKINALQVDFVK
ncbi:hypothetical protein K470DRAFT_254055 [Piedraia hortae CBS 480.64]|uniref:Uncharacterized protein n=1 Tax=Piedraia hortae CBS 480.64 TaxID=1314780 RepID=A0A6A7CA48_9PEZI|nr:hypothetical protein K470DRAFT_254055 [Piedraia hortae CBS 480.64]